MIIGTGFDLIEVERLQRAMEKNEHFGDKVFTRKEIEYCSLRANQYESYAARFAAKEALLKAMGTGWADGIQWTDIELYNQENGKPAISVSGIAAEKLQVYGSYRLHVSLSHLKSIAGATVIIEQL